jgi:hypothetical protein
MNRPYQSLPLFPAYLLLRIVRAAFSARSLKASIESIAIEYTYQVLHELPQEELARKFSKLEEHPRRFVIRQY